MNTITTYENIRSAHNVLDYGFDPIYCAYQIKDYRPRQPDEISTSSRRRIAKLLDNCWYSRGRYSGNYFIVTHQLKDWTRMDKLWIKKLGSDTISFRFNGKTVAKPLPDPFTTKVFGALVKAGLSWTHKYFLTAYGAELDITLIDNKIVSCRIIGNTAGRK